jgi:RNA polymerase sigma-70 factor (ECF subfamily)
MTEQSNTHMNSPTGEALLLQEARLDPNKFGELYQMYVERVYKYVYSHVGDVPAAEDITAQTFLAAYETFPRLRQDGCFAAWLFGIARNKTFDYFRRRMKTTNLQDWDSLGSGDDPAILMMQSEQAQQLAQMIKQLSEDDRELLRLRFLAQMSFAEIADLIQRKEDTVKKTVYRLLARLQSQAEASHE